MLSARGRSHPMLTAVGNGILFFASPASSPLLRFSFQMLMLAATALLEVNSLFSTWEFMDHRAVFSRFGTSVCLRDVCIFLVLLLFFFSSSWWLHCFLGSGSCGAS